MKYVFAVQIWSRGTYRELHEWHRGKGRGYDAVQKTLYRPFGNYWDAVEAALDEAQATGRNVRVVKRQVKPEDVPVFMIGETNTDDDYNWR